MLYPMRIIKESFLRAAVLRHPRAAEAVAAWIRLVRAAEWENPIALHRTFPHADPVKVRSGHTVYVFNLRGNEYGLIAALHFDQGRVFTLRFLTHAEYDRNRWKEEL
jgi:mRNA interferase HigB